MLPLVRSRLEAARKELLDLGLRNPLINYRSSLSRGVAIANANAAVVVTQLTEQDKAFSFVAVPEGVIAGASSKLQTSEKEEKLQQRLLKTYYAARTIIEEQGVNTLFLAAGMLHWYESESSAEMRKAPLLLVPVNLERSNARDKFRIVYSGEDMGSNISLSAKLLAEFGIELPALPDGDEWNWAAYCEAVAAAVSSQKRWQVAPDALCLDFFSFGRFLLYNDLDSDKWPADLQPADHSLLQNLLGEGFSETAPSVGETAFLDDEPATATLLQAVDADSTQLLAMLAVHEGRNLVIQGPPGTGKSQTITNIIANAIGQGKKVLFVAEKNAALEVVKRRLDALQLGEACLELHSHKTNKKELHAELRRTLELGKPALQHLQQQVSLLDQHRNELNAYSKAVNAEIGTSGLSAHQVTGRLLQLAAQTSGITLPVLHFKDIEQWDALRMQKAEALAERIRANLKEDAPPGTYAFWGSSLQALLPRQAAELAQLLTAAAQAANALSNTAVQMATETGLPVPEGRAACLKAAHALELVAAAPDLSGINIGAEGWEENKQTLENLIDAGERIAEIKRIFDNILLPEVWNADVLPLHAALLAHGKKWYRFFIGEYGRAQKQLAAYSVAALPKGTDEKLALTEAVLEVRKLETIIREGSLQGKTFFGEGWLGSSANWQTLGTATRFMWLVHEDVRKGLAPSQTLNLLLNKDAAVQAKSRHVQLLQLLNEHGRTIGAVTAAIAFTDQVRFPGSTLLHQTFSVQLPLLQRWAEQPAAINEVIQFNNLAAMAAEALMPLAELAAHWQHGKGYLLAALQHTWYHHLLETAITTFEPLQKFSRTAHETVAEQFRQLDLRNLQYNRAKAALKHWEGLPPADGGGQMSVLRNEFNKKGRHLPIRKLMSAAGLAIQAIKPVFMMSPLSIANFLPPGALDFDLVVFDEASQVRPVDALGAVLRGRQLVVVGDSQQLPPSSFFDTIIYDDAAQEESFTADMPSILGLCDAQGAPQRMLRWHYRSRHESLIRLSNDEFYNGRLVVFPSPGTRAGAGLVFHYLPQTIYDRGQTRTNPEEAAAVAQCVLDHVRKHPGQSLGVVAFSTAQRDAILDKIEELRRRHPHFEQGLLLAQQEPFFVKNLENVQGDERDVIFISVGYGRTAAGLVSQSFGPLNAAGGEKRLNVLMTRARLRCAVFTNITDEDIDTTKSASRGLQVLKSFLRHARQGVLHAPQPAGAPADSPFEDAVADSLLKLGYPVQRQVGSSGFVIDLAIADPEQPGRYILGIECNGASYHAARSARDRDRLRQQVLEAMGWRIYRIWSTDWFSNKDKELTRLREAIEKAWKEALHAGDEDDEPIADTAMLREDRKQAQNKLEPYQVAQLPAAIGEAEMHQHPVGKLAKWVEIIVRVEGPLHFDELAKRMVEAAGITRVGPRIKDHLKLATRFAEGSGAIRQSGDFLWAAGNAQPPLRDRSALPAASRKWKYVAPEERAGVLYKVVKEAVAISVEEAYPIVVKMLGFARLTEDMRTDILALIPPMITAGLLEEEGALLRVAA